MITHIVLFKLKDSSQESIRKAKDVLSSLAGKIPALRSLEVGADIIRSERSFHLALVARFDTLVDLDAYQNHPEHVKVANYMRGARESAVAVDYES